MHDQRYRRLCQASRDTGGRACLVGKRRLPARAEPRKPFAHRADRYREGRSNLRRSLPRDDTGNDLFSTVKRQAGILMGVVHPAGSSAGVRRLQPDPVPGEQPSENSHLEHVAFI